MAYEPIIGLEIHTELLTKTKMFCDCLNDPDEKQPNKNICPVCLAHPGALPTINKKAVESVIKAGLALGSRIPEFSKFDRKNYFYPDLPKGYQISQYDEPLCRGGKLKLYFSEDPEERLKEIEITRVHLEEDTGKLIHPEDKKSTLVDFNRAGIPLMELVTEPVIHTGREARLFAQGLQLLLRALGISEADMEKGQMRCEVNISLTPVSNLKSQNQKLGTKVEVKNLNSFKAVERAIDFEIQRQVEILEKGEKVIQETRGWDSIQEITYSQRIKEEAQDYRYFPEPDLSVLHLHSLTKEGGLFDLEKMKLELPELPWDKKKRIIQDAIKRQDATVHLGSLDLRVSVLPPNIITTANVLIQDKELDAWFEAVLRKAPKDLDESKKFNPLARNYFITDLRGLMKKENIGTDNLKILPSQFASLIQLLVENKISSRIAKDILSEMFYSGKDPEKLIKNRGLEKISDEQTLVFVIDEVIKNNLQAVDDYKKGKENAIQFLVGQAMAKLKGAADPKELEKLIQDKIAD